MIKIIFSSGTDIIRAATRIANAEERVVYAKTLEDGSYAVGLFNRGSAATTISIRWGPGGDLTTTQGPLRVRDLGRQKDLGTFNGRFAITVPPQEIVLVRLIPSP